ncbi:MAG: exodeoxyribonuclease VII small subunit [Chloroflexota bacterium]
MTPDQDLPAPIEQLTYEAAYAELEEIVSALEGDGRSLETALALYERGQALARRCAALLDQAELKVRQLSGDTLIEFSIDS